MFLYKKLVYKSKMGFEIKNKYNFRVKNRFMDKKINFLKEIIGVLNQKLIFLFKLCFESHTDRFMHSKK